ncbi:MAG: Gfo/Idh/MocA family oxidoreductase [Kiritimatiellae bacterium]|nr:Gfo/Idh/MocA family oxidoreductase [Kiritimatiellia bacterium]
MSRRIRMGMVGGGRGAFIGAVHRIAAQMDGKIEFVCGALSSTRPKALESGRDLLLPSNRIYTSYREMFRRESRLPEGERMDFVSIVTPNNMHYPVAMAALDAGFHVVCDKPMTVNIDEATNLARKLKQTGKLFCLTHNYTGYPMVKQARELVQKHKLGRIRRVVVEYPQGWLATRQETAGNKQAMWRTDPKRAGPSCCMGDIGTHCANLAEYIVGSRITEVCADLRTFVKGRPLDDDGSVLLRFENGASGVLWASQIAVGEENGLNIRVYGESGAIEWHQMEPNTLIVRWLNRPTEYYRTGTPFVGKAAAANTRLPPGHPEGYIEAFANIYRNFAAALEQVLAGKKIVEAEFDYPTVEDGIRGIEFLEAVIKSSKAKEKWVKVGSSEVPGKETP